jgi:hypothetical protein
VTASPETAAAAHAEYSGVGSSEGRSQHCQQPQTRIGEVWGAGAQFTGTQCGASSVVLAGRQAGRQAGRGVVLAGRQAGRQAGVWC